MKYAAERTFVDPDAAARKLVEIANAVDQRPLSVSDCRTPAAVVLFSFSRARVVLALLRKTRFD
ncbi:hypothetical protein QCM77_45915 [Bradyrhizobium sp. SSUT18]|uniref:hypothetical protein n=1 Tax=Bradyrhizobium sp. SSUT18 TaxID=3040602 RepID=UPI00244B6790|nr:hypothetical protein [Bradyrhizobium sp. SSUT18]MDH2407093.1 hypothetical protein [Bradyrhizobium sp. SSUT18]